MIPIEIDYPGTGQDIYRVDWSLNSQAVLRYGSGPYWIYGHSKYDGLGISIRPEFFTILPVLGLKVLGVDQSTTIEMGGFSWALTIMDSQEPKWSMVARSEEGILFAANYSFENQQDIPARVEVSEWRLPWVLPAPEYEVRSEGVSSRIDHLSSLAAIPSLESIDGRKVYQGLTSDVTGPAGDSEQFGRFPLSAAIDRATHDPRVQSFLSTYANSFVRSAQRSEMGTGGNSLSWTMSIGPGCQGTADPQIIVVVTRTGDPGAPVDVTTTASPSEPPCLASQKVTLTDLPPVWPTIDGAARYARSHGVEFPAEGAKLFEFRADTSCMHGSPWALAAGARGPDSDTWISIANGQLLYTALHGPSPGPFALPQECPPFFPV